MDEIKVFPNMWEKSVCLDKDKDIGELSVCLNTDGDIVIKQQNQFEEDDVIVLPKIFLCNLITALSILILRDE